MARAQDWQPSLDIAEKRREPCRNCGAMGVDLHHAIPRSMCRASRRDSRNCLPLCPKCHRGWHLREVTITRDVFRPDEWAYLCSVELRARDVMEWLDHRYPVSEGVFA